MMIYACFSFLNSIFAQFFAHADKGPFLLPTLKFPVTFLSSFKNFMLIYFPEVKFFNGISVRAYFIGVKCAQNATLAKVNELQFSQFFVAI